MKKTMFLISLLLIVFTGLTAFKSDSKLHESESVLMAPQGKSLFFNAEENDFVRVKEPSFTNFLDEKFSLELVFKMYDRTEKDQILLHYFDKNESIGIVTYINTRNQLVIKYHRQEYVMERLELSRDKCYHISIVKSGSKLFVYNEGSEIFSTRGDFMTVEMRDTPFYMGGYANSANFYGEIDEVRLFDTALQQHEINETLFQNLVTIDTGLLAYYNFNEGESQVVIDNSLYTNNGYLGFDERSEIHDPIREEATCVEFVEQQNNQEIHFCGTYIREDQPEIDPNSEEPYFFDRFGNVYLTSELEIPEGENTRNTRDTDLFTINFNNADHITSDMEEVIEQVFSDVEVMINQRQGNEDSICTNSRMVRIRVETYTADDNSIARASSIYALYSGQSAPNHIVYGRTWERINGLDPITNVYDGFLHINLHNQDNRYYGFQDPMPDNSQTDFYSVILHEVLHILGFHSFFNADGSGHSQKGYTAYDTHLRNNNVPLIVQTPDLYDWEFNPSLNADVLISGCTNINFLNTDDNDQTPSFAPAIWDSGSSLSHLDDDCSTENYVMHPTIAQNTIKRITDTEAQILQNLGYDLNTTYGEQNLITGGVNPRMNNESLTLNANNSILGTSDDLFCEFRTFERCDELIIPYDYLLSNDFFSGEVDIVNLEVVSNEVGVNLVNDIITREIIVSIDENLNPDISGQLLIRYQITDGINLSENSSIFEVFVYPCHTVFFTNNVEEICDIIDNSEFNSTSPFPTALKFNYNEFLPNWSHFVNTRLATINEGTFYINENNSFDNINIITTPLSNENGHIYLQYSAIHDYDSGLFTTINFHEADDSEQYILSYFRAIGQDFENSAQMSVFLTDFENSNFPTGAPGFFHDDVLSNLSGYEMLYDDQITNQDRTSYGHMLLNFNPAQTTSLSSLVFMSNGSGVQLDNIQLYKDQFANNSLPTDYVYNENCDDSTTIDIDLCEIPGIVYEWFDVTTGTAVSLGQGTTVDAVLTVDSMIEVRRGFEDPTINSFTLPNRVNQVFDNDAALPNGYANHTFNVTINDCRCPDIVDIPDPNFEQYLIDQGIDSDGLVNGEVSRLDAENVNALSISAQGISNLTGINCFVNLTSLSLSANNLVNIDLYDNENLIDVTIKAETLLESVRFGPSLEQVIIKNTALNDIYVEESIDLNYLLLENNNLSTINLLNNINLELLDVARNNLSELNIENNDLLVDLSLWDNNINTLVVNDKPNLEILRIGDNPIANVDVSNNSLLRIFNLSSCLFTNLDITNNSNLITLLCSNNQLSNLDVTNNLSLGTLVYSDNNISMIDLSQNSLLGHLECSNNGISNIDVSLNVNLGTFISSGNPLSSIDLSQNTNLNNLRIEDSNIVNLNLSFSAELTNAYINNNASLVTIDASDKNQVLDYQFRDNTLLSILDMTSIVQRVDYVVSCGNTNLSCISVDNYWPVVENCINFGPNWVVDSHTSINCRINETNGETKIEQSKISNFHIYPNPTDNILNISSLQIDSEVVNIDIYNVFGRLVMSRTFHLKGNTFDHKLNIEDLEKGVYFIKINTNDGFNQNLSLIKN